MSEQKRQIAYKVRIKDVLEGEYIKEEGWNPNYINNNGKKLSRINLIATVVGKDNSNVQTIEVDDGTGRISLKDFDNNKNLEQMPIGQVILTIGRPREYGGERYILAEIAKPISDHKWIMVRNLELNETIVTKEPKKTEEAIEKIEEVQTEEVATNSPSEEIIEHIRTKDTGEGAELDTFIENEQMKKTIDMLLKEGEIFEIKPGKYKVLE